MNYTHWYKTVNKFLLMAYLPHFLPPELLLEYWTVNMLASDSFMSNLYSQLGYGTGVL